MAIGVRDSISPQFNEDSLARLLFTFLEWAVSGLDVRISGAGSFAVIEGSRNVGFRLFTLSD
jgi:hypothetical protein